MIWRSMVTVIFYLLDIVSDIANAAYFIKRDEKVSYVQIQYIDLDIRQTMKSIWNEKVEKKYTNQM